MEQFLTSTGYPALFLLSFLAATLLPLGSEWLLVLMLLKGYNPAATLAVATAGNFLGAVITYWIGLYGGPFLVRRVLRMQEAAIHRAKEMYGRYGSWSLLFSWVPVIGDPLCLVGGMLEIRFGRFFLLVMAGKLVRYGAIAWLALKGVPLLA